MTRPTPVRLKWGRVFKKYRLLSEMTQADLAQKLGCGTAAITGWERGIRTPSPDMVAEIVKVLGIPPSALFEDPIRPAEANVA